MSQIFGLSLFRWLGCRPRPAARPREMGALLAAVEAAFGRSLPRMRAEPGGGRVPDPARSGQAGVKRRYYRCRERDGSGGDRRHRSSDDRTRGRGRSRQAGGRRCENPRGEGHHSCTAESRNRKTGEPRKNRGSGAAGVRIGSARSEGGTRVNKLPFLTLYLSGHLMAR